MMDERYIDLGLHHFSVEVSSRGTAKELEDELAKQFASRVHEAFRYDHLHSVTTIVVEARVER